MSLRTLAESDLSFLVEDEDSGAGWPITLVDPNGLEKPLTGLSNDIAQVIDPDTGQAVSGRSASVAIRISSITAAGFTSLPRNIADATLKPWIVRFDDINGNAYSFKVTQSNPDRAVGLIVCILGQYE